MDFDSHKKIKKKVAIVLVVLLILITLLTNYYGSTDLGDYSDTAKYFAGMHSADIRSSHSYLYGFIHAPLVKLSKDFFFFKITSLIFLALIVFSVYTITKRNKKSLLLILFSPVVWYMAPWISPIQLASLFFLWAFYFIRKYDENRKLRNAIFSGALVGLGFAFWDTVIFFGSFLIFIFMYNRKTIHFFLAYLSILIGLIPRLLLDYYLFNFAFFTTLKNFFGTLTNAFFLGRGTAYSSIGLTTNAILFILILFSLPLYFWKVYQKKFFCQNHKEMIFLSASLLLILINPQIRYTLIIAPIFILILSKELTHMEFRKSLFFSLIITLIFILPLFIQIGFSFNNSNYYDITEILTSKKLSISRNSEDKLIKSDLIYLTSDFPNKTFLVVGHTDYYKRLANLYWGENVEEFVSIQDYELWQNNETILFEKRLEFFPERIRDRRSIWFGGGINRNILDTTDYSAINYALTLNNTDTVPNFHKIKKYQALTLWQKN